MSTVLFVIYAIVGIPLIIVGLLKEDRTSRVLTAIGVTLFVLVGVIAIILPALTSNRRTARAFQNSTQVRGLHLVFITHAQTNNHWYAGLDNAGNIIAPSVEARFRILLDARQFLPQYLISFSEEKQKTPWTAGPLTTDHYSFTLLQLPTTGGRHDEWRDTHNKLAPILADRLIPHGSGFKSVHTSPKQPNATEWRGSVAWNDNHVSFEPDFLLDTQYSTTSNPDDNLFQPTSSNDAWLIYTGNGEAEGEHP